MRCLEAPDESIVPLSEQAAVGAVAPSLLACGRNPGPVSNLLISESFKWWSGKALISITQESQSEPTV